jgi:hypothetical protein
MQDIFKNDASQRFRQQPTRPVKKNSQIAQKGQNGTNLVY